jgi:predicted ATP-dependent endonuclease of OLD family
MTGNTTVHLKSITIPDNTDRFSKLKGQKIEFQPGLNFIVGENGIGKSSIFALLQGELTRDFQYTTVGVKESETLHTYHFDTEKMNPRKSSTIRSAVDVISRFTSHGETMEKCLRAVKQAIAEENGPLIILIDEPESGLSPWTQKDLLKLFERLSNKHQFLIATHSTVFTSGDVGTVVWLSEEGTRYYTPPKTFDWS